MAIKLQLTSEVEMFVKCLVYGRAGVGKTTLLTTAPNPIILSHEGGLLSIRKTNTPFLEITCLDDLKEAYSFVKGKKGKKFTSIGIDSLTDICQVVLAELKREEKDPRQAYMKMADIMFKWIRKFRDLKGKHVIFTAQNEFSTSQDGVERGMPSVPGNQLKTALPYMFDEVFYMHIEEDDEDEDPYRAIQTDVDIDFEAKDRSGTLDFIERPDLGYIFNKILSDKPKKKKGK